MMTNFFFIIFGIVAGCGLCILTAGLPRKEQQINGGQQRNYEHMLRVREEQITALEARIDELEYDVPVGACIPRRGRNLTGAYQSVEREIESARQIQADLENEIEGYRAQIDDLQTALRKAKAVNGKLHKQLQQQSVQPVVERPNRFEFLEIKGGER